MKSWLASLALAAAFVAVPGSVSAQDSKKGGKDWSDHTGNIRFIVGSERGIKEAEFQGKPILYFFTTTW